MKQGEKVVKMKTEQIGFASKDKVGAEVIVDIEKPYKFPVYKDSFTTKLANLCVDITIALNGDKKPEELELAWIKFKKEISF